MLGAPEDEGTKWRVQMGDVSIRVLRQRLVRPAAASGRSQALRAPLWDDRDLDHGRVQEAKRKREERQWERVVFYRELDRQRWRIRQGGVGWERTPRGRKRNAPSEDGEGTDARYQDHRTGDVAVPGGGWDPGGARGSDARGSRD